jgi:hypothetical protein
LRALLESNRRSDLPDAYELRLLLSEEFEEKLDWAMDWFFKQEIFGRRGREWGVAQSLVASILPGTEWLQLGAEMEYRNQTLKDSRGDPHQIVVIGPEIALYPTRSTQIDISPLFGCTHDSPRVQALVIFSVLLGPPAQPTNTQQPTATRHR